MVIPVGTHAGGVHIGGPHGAIGAHAVGAQAGGAQGGGHGGGQQTGRHTGRLGAGARMPAMTADGIPITAPQMLVQAPSKAPHIPKGDGGRIPQHGGGGQHGCTAGAQVGAGGPPATPTANETENKSVVRNAKIATTLSAIPKPPFLTPLKS
ncbi:MAG: hypothetical protein ACP5U1_10245 [Desulfomonilaceae bacterium]